MLYWALVFLVVAIIAGALGFGGIAGTSAGIAQILFFIFLAFLVISLLAGLFRRARSRASEPAQLEADPLKRFSATAGPCRKALSGGLHSGFRQRRKGTEPAFHGNVKPRRSKGTSLGPGDRTRGNSGRGAGEMSVHVSHEAFEAGAGVSEPCVTPGCPIFYQDPELRILWAENVPRAWAQGDVRG